MYTQTKFRMQTEQEDMPTLVEGLTLKGHTVALTDDTKDGVDFVAKPLVYKFHNHNVISIFKRMPFGTDIKMDGNPFIYALKGIHGWPFNMSSANIIKYLRRFINNCNQISKTYDTVIIVPSQYDVNRRFMYAIKSIVGYKNSIEAFFFKVEIDDPDSLIDHDKLNKDFTPYAKELIYDRIYKCFNKMKSGYFESKYMDKDLMKYLSMVVAFDRQQVADIAPMIDGKNVLILDDTLSSGKTISDCAKIIESTFNPKKLTFITLLSKKFSK